MGAEKGSPFPACSLQGAVQLQRVVRDTGIEMGVTISAVAARPPLCVASAGTTMVGRARKQRAGVETGMIFVINRNLQGPAQGERVACHPRA